MGWEGFNSMLGTFITNLIINKRQLPFSWHFIRGRKNIMKARSVEKMRLTAVKETKFTTMSGCNCYLLLSSLACSRKQNIILYTPQGLSLKISERLINVHLNSTTNPH